MMTEIHQNGHLYLKYGKEHFGWGVFTNQPILSGETVEICYCLVEYVFTTQHKDYVFTPNPNSTDCYNVLGYGAIYNHSDEPNISWREIDRERHLIEFFALRDIMANEELTHNYGPQYWEKRKNKQNKLI